MFVLFVHVHTAFYQVTRSVLILCVYTYRTRYVVLLILECNERFRLSTFLY